MKKSKDLNAQQMFCMTFSPRKCRLLDLLETPAQKSANPFALPFVSAQVEVDESTVRILICYVLGEECCHFSSATCLKGFCGEQLVQLSVCIPTVGLTFRDDKEHMYSISNNQLPKYLAVHSC